MWLGGPIGSPIDCPIGGRIGDPIGCPIGGPIPSKIHELQFRILFHSWQRRDAFLLRHYIQNGSHGDLSFYPLSVSWTFF